MSKKISKHELLNHETKKHLFLRFLGVLAVVLVYFAVIAIKYGVTQGILITALTWSFFVFCTPIADAGVLLAFPMRLLTGLRMIYSQIVVWVVAFILNLIVLPLNPQVYQTNFILKLFYRIITTPYPFWIIIIISAAGTFFSIHFGDELLDVARHRDRAKYAMHKKKYRMIVMVFAVVIIIILYNFLLKTAGINLL